MAPPYGEPDWATPGDTSNVVTQSAPAATAQPTTVAGVVESRKGSAGCTLVMLSFFNIALSSAMGALGILTLLEFKPSAVNDYSTAFLSVYMVIFGVLLFLYELIWWQPIMYLNRVFRKNFGFMYGLKGKGFYLIFIAFLCLGLQDTDASAVEGLDWATGIGWLVGGIGHVSLAMCWPDIAEKYKPPISGMTASDDDINNVV